MREDDLERSDVENVLLKGKIDKRLTRDPRGTRYRIEGPAHDGRVFQVVCRLDEEVSLRIITIYALER